MSESFLERWSRRKRDVVKEASEPPTVVEDFARDLAAQDLAAQDLAAQDLAAQDLAAQDLAARDLAAQPPGEPPATGAAEAPAFDLSQLPSVESITAETDIRAFLGPGVPASLRHAALRRAWSADPTIRDFVGLSENSWDFTAPDGVPGFGPIGSPEEVQRLLAQLMGAPQESAEKSGSEPAEETPQVSALVEESGVDEMDAAVEMSQALQHAQQEQAGPDKTSESHNIEMLQHNTENDAMQHEQMLSEYEPMPGRRSHGRALPE